MNDTKQTQPDKLSLDPFGTHTKIIDAVPEKSCVLDIGCSSGYIGKILHQEKGCEITGVEPHQEAAAEAMQAGYKYVYISSIEEAIQKLKNSDQRFDVIILADVLEHILAPRDVLKQLHSLLTSQGNVIVSLPNVAHYSTRWMLLRGGWNYADAGIMDRTHLWWFTKRSAQDMFKNSGYKVYSWQPRGDVARLANKLKLVSVGKMLETQFAGFFAVQHIFVLTRDEN